MKIFNVEDRTEMLIEKLCNVWEKSVRATHLFLSDSEVKEIAKYIPVALKKIPYLIIASNNENVLVAFMGIDGEKLEMLFLSPEERGKGLGKQLIQYGMKYYSINKLAVNEQNPQAKGFYEHLGFQVYKRTDIDEQGNPYPILYMNLP
jgi:putative acetyltransferase